MPPAAKTRRTAAATGIVTVGIDVGGERKGFHAVALTDGGYLNQLSTKCVRKLADWCQETIQARVIAVDAPCAWSTDVHSRPAERELMEYGIWCFSTPTREAAVRHPGNHFGWMLKGEEVFRALADEFPICRQLPVAREKYCFETFPHAITWHLRGGNADARRKRTQRRELLGQAKIDLSELTNIDLVDAALCALTAYYVASGEECVAFGEPNTGLIICPRKKR